MTSRVLRLTGALAAAAMSMAACSAGGESSTPGAAGPGSDAAISPASEVTDPLVTDPLATDTLTTDPLAPDPLTTDPSATPPAPASTVPPAEELPELLFTALGAGPFQLAASECAIDVLPPGDPMAGGPMGVSASGVSSLALEGSRAYLPAPGGVAVFTLDTSAGCTMSLDTTIGDAGVLTTDDPIDSVAVSATGRLAATGPFGTTVFDVSSGGSFSCELATGEVDIADDGSRLLTSFPGSAVEQFELTDTGCAAPTEVALPADIVEPYYVSYDGADLLVGGLALDQAVYAGRVSDGRSQWRIGNLEPGGPGWIGWVHGMAPCSGGFCVLDTNTDKLVVTDALGGLRAEFAVSDLIGAQMFYETIELGADGALYLLATTSAADGAGGRIFAAHVVRIEVTG